MQALTGQHLGYVARRCEVKAREVFPPLARPSRIEGVRQVIAPVERERAAVDRERLRRAAPFDALDPFDLGAIMLVADMGSAVLLEVPYADAEREPASLLMMRSEAGWRLRELFD